METILLIKRNPVGEFQGDKTWQVAPYAIRDERHALRIVEWLRRSVDFTYRIVFSER